MLYCVFFVENNFSNVIHLAKIKLASRITLLTLEFISRYLLIITIGNNLKILFYESV